VEFGMLNLLMYRVTVGFKGVSIDREELAMMTTPLSLIFCTIFISEIVVFIAYYGSGDDKRTTTKVADNQQMFITLFLVNCTQILTSIVRITIPSKKKLVMSDGSRVSSVGIATRYRLDGPGIESRWGRDFPHPSRLALRFTQPPIQWVPGLFPGLKRPGRGVDHPPHLAPR
jgi:hypothetical protein